MAMTLLESKPRIIAQAPTSLASHQAGALQSRSAPDRCAIAQRYGKLPYDTMLFGASILACFVLT
jgi:hypothetical protein